MTNLNIVKIQPDLHFALKIQAAKERCTLQDLVDKLLRKALQGSAIAKAVKRS